MGTLCLQCGDRGFDNAFVYCVKCLEFAVHRYCLDEIPKTVDEFVRWVCDDCYSKEYPHTPRHYDEWHSPLAEQYVVTDEMAIVMGGDGSCQLPKSPLLQISGPLHYVDVNVKEDTRDCFNDGGKSDLMGTELVGGDGSTELLVNPSVQLSGPMHYVDMNVKENPRDCFGEGGKSNPEVIDLMSCDGSKEQLENPSVQLSGPMNYAVVHVKEYTRGSDEGNQSNPNDIGLKCVDGLSEHPKCNPVPVQLSGPMNYIDMHVKECIKGHHDDGKNSNSEDLKLIGIDGSNELPQNPTVQLSRPTKDADANIKEIANKSASVEQSSVELSISSESTSDVSSSSASDASSSSASRMIDEMIDEMADEMFLSLVGYSEKGGVPGFGSIEQLGRQKASARSHIAKNTAVNKKNGALFNNLGGSKKGKVPRLGPLAQHRRCREQMNSLAKSNVYPNKFPTRQLSDNRNMNQAAQVPMTQPIRPTFQFAPQMQQPMQFPYPPLIPQWGGPWMPQQWYPNLPPPWIPQWVPMMPPQWRPMLNHAPNFRPVCQKK